MLVSSPHTWGCFRLLMLCLLIVVVFPTHVGVFLEIKALADGEWGLPHTRGGVSERSCIFRRLARSSPHTWGCFYGLQCKSGKRSVFPTHVGVFPALFYLLHPSLCLPHTRGGVSDRRAVCWTRNRSSPHAWGCFRHQRLVPAATTVFPTRVGVFLSCRVTT